jgi:hypothetical protein
VLGGIEAGTNASRREAGLHPPRLGSSFSQVAVHRDRRSKAINSSRPRRSLAALTVSSTAEELQKSLTILVDSDLYGPFADIVANRGFTASTKSPVPKFASNRFPAPSRDSRHGRSGYLPVTWSWGRLDRVARKCNWADK